MSEARIVKAVAAAVLALAAADASAQLYKCKGPDGKIVYSDQRCEANDTAGKLAPGVTNRARENEERAAAEKAAQEKADEEARRQAEALVAAQKKLGVAPASPSASGAPATLPAASQSSGSVSMPQAYQPTGAERERLRELEMTTSSIGATREQKEAARLEMSSIRSGRESRLSSDDRRQRESLHTDMMSADAKTRQHALQSLREIYNH